MRRTRRREGGDSACGCGYQAGRLVSSAEHERPVPGRWFPQTHRATGRSRLAARAGFGAGVARVAREHAAGGLRGAAPSCGRGPCRLRSGRSPAPPRAPARVHAVHPHALLVLGVGHAWCRWAWRSMAFSAVAFRDADHWPCSSSGGRRVVAGRVRDRRCATWLFLRVPRSERAAAGRARSAGAPRWRRWSGRRYWPPRNIGAADLARRPALAVARARRRPRGAGLAGRARVRACAWRAGCARPAQGGAGRYDEDGQRVAHGRDDQRRCVGSGVGTIVSFHAHPDDEAIATGGTLARAAAAGHRVVLVFATRGELGEPVPGVLEPGEPLADPALGRVLRLGRGARGQARGVPRLHRLRDDGRAVQQRAVLLLAGQRRARRPPARGDPRRGGAGRADRSTTTTAATATRTTSRCTGSGAGPASCPRCRWSRRAP